MRSNFGWIPPLTEELVALERMTKLMYTLVTCSTEVPSFFNRNFFFIAGKKDNHKISDDSEIRPDLKTDCIFVCIFFILAGYKDKYKISSNFSRIAPLMAKLAALECLKNQLSCSHTSLFVFDWIFFILAGNQDCHKRLDEFEFRPNRTSGSGVSCR